MWGIPNVQTIQDTLAQFGFALENMGGNCTAYVRHDGEIEERITLRHEPRAPQALNDECSVGTYNNAAQEEGDNIIEDGHTLRDILAALAHPSDEYALLSLRLYNGLHIR